MRRLATSVLAAALGLGALLAAPRAEAQEIQLTGPLAGAPAVRKLRQYREGRFEIAPTVSFSLLDEYRRTILVGARIQYNIKDWISIGAWGGYGLVSLSTDLTDQIDQTAPRNSRTGVNVNHTSDASGNITGKAPFTDQTAKMQWVVSVPNIQFTPFRGKLAVFQKLFIDTDLYVHGGLGIIGLQERGDCGDTGQKACSDPGSFALVSRVAFAPTFGLGLNFYTGDFLSIGVEYRALPFAWNRAGFDQRGGGTNGNFPDLKINSEDRTFKFNQMISIAVGFSFPAAPKISE